MLMMRAGTIEQNALARRLDDAFFESGQDGSFAGSVSGSAGRFHVVISERDSDRMLWDRMGNDAEIVDSFRKWIKPLFVQVAEVLGWTQCRGTGFDDWHGVRPSGGLERIPRYDQYDDLLNGALQQLGLTVQRQGSEASVEFLDQRFDEVGPTPQMAVCYLILKLKEAGRLR